MQKIKMIPCPKCENPFPELRKTEYGYNFCVDCSSVDRVVGITTVEGSGDHTYNDIIIMDQGRALAIERAANEAMGRRVPDAVEILDMDRDETDVSQSIKEKVNNTQEDEVYNVTTQQKETEESDDNMRIKGIDY